MHTIPLILSIGLSIDPLESSENTDKNEEDSKNTEQEKQNKKTRTKNTEKIQNPKSLSQNKKKYRLTDCFSFRSTSHDQEGDVDLTLEKILLCTLDSSRYMELVSILLFSRCYT